MTNTKCEPHGFENCCNVEASSFLSTDDCLNHSTECDGNVEYRMPLSGTGKSFPRCDFHWDQRLDQEQVNRERYPEHAPADFDPYYAGESWDDDY